MYIRMCRASERGGEREDERVREREKGVRKRVCVRESAFTFLNKRPIEI